MKCHTILAGSGHAHHRTPRKIRMNLGTKRMFASRPVSVFGDFHGENHKKFVQCRKIMKTCMRDGRGDAGMCKKVGVHRLSRKRKRTTELTSFISDQCRLHGWYEVACMKRHPILGGSGHAHLRAPRKI